MLTPATAAKALALGKFVACEGDGLFIARTGYTGEDGFEIVVPEGEAVALWNRLAAAGVAPSGLGARDTLRLEAGMNLYGQDMDETTTPWEAGLAWTVALDADRDFIGRRALEAQKKEGVPRELVGGQFLHDLAEAHDREAEAREGFEELVVFSVILLAAVAVGNALWIISKLGGLP